jgi:hypothetical protein
MAYQDPQDTTQPYDVDEELRRLLEGDQADAATPTTTTTPATTPADTTPADTTPGVTPAAATAPAAPAPTGGLPAQPSTAATAASAYDTNWDDYYTQTPGQTGGNQGPGQPGTPAYEAAQAAAAANQPTAPTAQPTTTDYSRNTDWGAPGAIEGYFTSRGVTPFPTSVDYWKARWSEWGSRDPEYFFKRLSQADEFTGAGANYDWQAAQGLAPATAASGAGARPDTSVWRDPAIADAIARLLARGETPVTGDEPGIRSQFNPTAQVIQRNADRAKANASERAFAQGQYGGQGSATSVANSQIDQASNLDQAQLMAELVKTEIAGRRADVVNALTFAQGSEKMALQQYLSELDAALQRQQQELTRLSLAQQDARYYAGLNFDIGREESRQNEGA